MKETVSGRTPVVQHQHHGINSTIRLRPSINSRRQQSNERSCTKGVETRPFSSTHPTTGRFRRSLTSTSFMREIIEVWDTAGTSPRQDALQNQPDPATNTRWAYRHYPPCKRRRVHLAKPYGYTDAPCRTLQDPELVQGEVNEVRPTLTRSTSRRCCAATPISPHGQPLRCLLYTSPSPRDKRQSRMPSSA